MEIQGHRTGAENWTVQSVLRMAKHTRGISDKHHGGENEENMRMNHIAIVACKLTDLTGLMTPGPGVTSPGLDIWQARRKATVCGCGKFNLMIDPSYL